MSFQKISKIAAAKNAKLVVVAKNREIAEIQKIVDAGAKFLAFNRVAEAAEKFPKIKNFRGKKVLIGHLQKNKIKKAIEIFDEIHSVDSEILARKIAEKSPRKMPILFQINVDRDENKFGFLPEDFEKSAKNLAKIENLKIRGVMTIGKKKKNPRETFENLKKIFDKTKKIFGDDFTEISMGMSGDFEIALECGATQIRVGSAIFKN